MDDLREEKIAFLHQVRDMTKEELLKISPMPPIKQEGMMIRTADFYGVNPNGYDLFDSEEERLALLKEEGIKPFKRFNARLP